MLNLEKDKSFSTKKRFDKSLAVNKRGSYTKRYIYRRGYIN